MMKPTKKSPDALMEFKVVSLFSGQFQVERSPSPFGKTPQEDLFFFSSR